MKKIDFHIHTKTSSQDCDFNFCLEKLCRYIDEAHLDSIAITNHNLFDKEQFETIKNRVEIPIFPGIEVDVEKCHILVISKGIDIDDFAVRCSLLSQKFDEVGDVLSVDEFKHILGDLNQYLLIPHFDKKPKISERTLKPLSDHITAGEVSSPKKFMYCISDDERLVPLYFSDCRISSDLNPLPTKQTFLDINDVSFSAIKECIRNKSKVSLSEGDGNSLFQIFENGQHISTGLNVVIGERSSGKSHTLRAISDNFPNVLHIKQFALVAKDEAEEHQQFNEFLTQNQGLFSKEHLSGLQMVIEDVIDIDLADDERKIDDYLISLFDFAKETEKQDTYSKARIYSEVAFSIGDLKGLNDLISSTKKYSQ